jgi:hypothetical protein
MRRLERTQERQARRLASVLRVLFYGDAEGRRELTLQLSERQYRRVREVAVVEAHGPALDPHPVSA